MAQLARVVAEEDDDPNDFIGTGSSIALSHVHLPYYVRTHSFR
jgi:hypothetical protein